MNRLALLLLPLLGNCASLPADSPRATRELSSILAGRSPGAPTRCLERQGIEGPQILGARTLVYRENRQRVWVNTLPHACPGIRTNSLIVVQMYGSQMCEGDRFRPAQATDIAPGAVCRLGSFVPWELPRR